MYWTLLFVFLLVIEVITVNLVTIWFAFGALAAYISSLITDNIFIQTSVFILVSVIALLLTKRISKKIANRKVERTNADRAIGKIGILTEGITKYKYGKMDLDGKTWSVNSDEIINAGEEVEVISIEGVKLIVVKKECEK